MSKTSLAVAALVIVVGASLGAQTISKATPVTASATIQAIDTATRKITLRNEKGEEDSFVAGPDVQRFNELKVGDRIRMTYYESVVIQVRKPGEASNPAGAQAAVTPSATKLPGGTIAVQERRTVTVRSVDPAANSVVVTTEDGKNIMRKVEDRAMFERFKPGDRIDITYTLALLTSVTRAN